MKKNWRKILSVMLALIMVVTLIPFVGMVKPVETKADGTKQIIVENCDSDTKVATYTFGSRNVVVTFNQSALAGTNVVAENDTISAILNALNGAVSSITGLDATNDRIQLRSDEPQGFTAELTYSGGVFTTDATGIPANYDIHFEVVGRNSGGGGSNPPPQQQTYTVDFGAGSWTVGGTNVSATIGGTAVSGRVEVANNAVINFSNINRETMDIYCESEDHFNMVLAIDDSGNASLGNSFPNGKVIALVVEPKGTHQAGGGPGPGGQRADVKIMLGCDPAYDGQSWTGEPMIDQHRGTITAPYAENYKGEQTADGHPLYSDGVQVWVLDGDQQWDGALRSYRDRAEDGFIHFQADTGVAKRKIVVMTSWSDVLETVAIKSGENGNPVDFTNQLIRPDVDMDVYFQHFRAQRIYYVFEVDANPDEKYFIDVAVRPLSVQECSVGNFLWSDDPASLNDPAHRDSYVENAVMSLISIEVPGRGYYDEAQINDGKCPYVGDYQSSSENHEGIRFGSMFVPTGAKVTMKITPQQGYQVTTFTCSGSDFVAGDANHPGEFTFTVGKGNFHLGGTAIKAEDAVKATATSVSDVDANITAGGQFTNGSASLTIANANIPEGRMGQFSTVATKADLDLIGGENAFLAIDLDQVILKANGADEADKENDAWTQAIHDLGDGYADVTMKFGNDVDVSTVVLVHNIGDGEDFETIRPISYDASKHTATFRIKSFSTFAIAQAHTKTVPVTPSNTNTNTNTNTNGGGSGAPAATTVDTVPKTAETFPIVPVMVVAIVSFATMAVVVFERKRRA